MAVPNFSTTFRWNGSEVASIAKQGAIYIRSLIPLPDEDENDDSNSTENEVDICNIFIVISSGELWGIVLKEHIKLSNINLQFNFNLGVCNFSLNINFILHFFSYVFEISFCNLMFVFIVLRGMIWLTKIPLIWQ